MIQYNYIYRSLIYKQKKGTQITPTNKNTNPPLRHKLTSAQTDCRSTNKSYVACINISNSKKVEETLSKDELNETSALFCSKATEAETTPSRLLSADSTEFEHAAHVIPVTPTWILRKLSESSSSWAPNNLSSSPASSELFPATAVSWRSLPLGAIPMREESVATDVDWFANHARGEGSERGR